jgi:HAD domain in Swiss Army Knife RNA repair proteins
MDDGSFELVRVRGQLVWVRSGAGPEEIEEALALREDRADEAAAFAAGLPASFDPDDPRPLLLVDVDGVVCPYGDELADPAAAGLAQATIGYSPVWLHDRISDRMRRLGKSFQLVWCTAWEDRAAQSLAPHLGLPALPVIYFDEPAEEDGHWKWPAIEAFVGDRPFAWIDDELGRADLARAGRRAVPTLLVRVEGTRGLADAHVEQLESFAATVRMA